MLYNIKKKKTQTLSDCFSCPLFNLRLKKCSGLGTVCFEYDAITKTVIDPVTHLPLKTNNKEI